ncbi:MAG: hypothetical protein ACKV22_34450 [Bryobacteraceae bacterium]
MDAILPVQAFDAESMTTIVKEKTPLTVPVAIQRRAGIAAGDQVEFKVTRGAIIIETVPEPSSYKPTRAELAAIRKGEAQIARGEHSTLTNLLNDMDSHRRKSGRKATRKLPA